MVYIVATVAFLWSFNRLVLMERTNRDGRPTRVVQLRKQSLPGALMKIVVLVVAGGVLSAGIIALLQRYWVYIAIGASIPPVSIFAYRLIRWLVISTDGAYQRDTAFARRLRWRRRFTSVMPDMNND